MNTKVKRIALLVMIVLILVFFFMPFKTQFDYSMGFTANGIGLVMGSDSHVKITYTITDKETGAISKINVGENKPELYAILAVILILIAAAFTFFKGNKGRVLPGVCLIGCAVSLFLLKLKIDQDILDMGAGFFTITWEWGFWMTFAVSITAALFSLLPAKNKNILDEPQNETSEVIQGSINNNEDIKQI